ncbi:nuclear transport factor 2 family protein [Mesorhizobium australicum]|uniref:SnoaL-like domain-containing protein n=1 Tax=Mesorhizobium australicum TaxID=536018 RepID=A0A1X7NYM4_9HYPH|nr:nuclear transport factor 2 family protein [Mesorhizobium australicum]SMH43402.1 SnoaL-like domain-containing protein [Mesorhizobium australicum]
MDQAKLTELIDREAIRDCLYRYCRGIDRGDEAALRSSYWPDATDRHGAYSGPVEGFIQMALGVFKTNPRNIHQVSNILIEFRSATDARVETYFNALQRGPGQDGVVRQFLLAGRYCDAFEKRGEEWRVARRTVAYDWVEEQTPPEGSDAERFGVRQPVGGFFPHDPVYALLKD